MNHNVCDVLVIGGGPAGATAAAALARAGHSVIVCEQATFPRFHIGESLLPAGNEVLAAIGVWEQVEQCGFVRKLGAEFETADGSVQVHNVFAEGLRRSADYAYQVERSKFDHLLLTHARESGAHLIQPMKVVETRSDANGWVARLGDGRMLHAAFLIDASGRNTFVARQQKIPRVRLPYEPKVAIYGHFRGVRRASGMRSGNIIITRWREGWFWNIPLDAEHTSVGLVTPVSVLKQSGGDPAVLFHSVVAASPVVAERMESSTRKGEFHVTADYTYAYQRFAGDRFILTGDAACFIDPVFSSGVCLALKSGYSAADRVSSCLIQRRSSLSKSSQRCYARNFRRDVAVMRGLIDAFYDRRALEVFLRPSSKWKLFEAINSIVGGRTRLPWSLRWRYGIFRSIIWLHRRRAVAEPIGERVLGAEIERKQIP